MKVLSYNMRLQKQVLWKAFEDKSVRYHVMKYINHWRIIWLISGFYLWLLVNCFDFRCFHFGVQDVGCSRHRGLVFDKLYNVDIYVFIKVFKIGFIALLSRCKKKTGIHVSLSIQFTIWPCFSNDSYHSFLKHCITGHIFLTSLTQKLVTF